MRQWVELFDNSEEWGEEGWIFQPIVVGTEVEEDFDRFAFRGISSCAETRLEN